MVTPIEKDDGCGFGDKILCCPNCEKPIVVPLFTSPSAIKCSCGTVLSLKKLFDFL